MRRRQHGVITLIHESGAAQELWLWSLHLSIQWCARFGSRDSTAGPEMCEVSAYWRNAISNSTLFVDKSGGVRSVKVCVLGCRRTACIPPHSTSLTVPSIHLWHQNCNSCRSKPDRRLRRTTLVCSRRTGCPSACRHCTNDAPQHVILLGALLPPNNPEARCALKALYSVPGKQGVF